MPQKEARLGAIPVLSCWNSKIQFKPFPPLEWRGPGPVSRAVPHRTLEETCSKE